MRHTALHVESPRVFGSIPEVHRFCSSTFRCCLRLVTQRQEDFADSSRQSEAISERCTLEIEA